MGARSAKRTKRQQVLYRDEGEVITLCHSRPTVPPDGPGGGQYRPKSSVVWARATVAGVAGEWVPTPLRSIRRAIAACEKCGDPAAALGRLTGGN